MGRKAIFDVKSLKIGEKLAFPKRKEKYIYQYLNNFNRSATDGERYERAFDDGINYIKRVL